LLTHTLACSRTLTYIGCAGASLRAPAAPCMRTRHAGP
jgi:hypothetical protein